MSNLNDEMLNKAAALGNDSKLISACYNVMNLTDEKEYPQTVECIDSYMMACLNKHVDEFQLGVMLDNADPLMIKTEILGDLICSIYEREIKNDNSAAMNNLGAFHENNKDGKGSMEFAFKCYTMASNEGYTIATTNLAYCYFYDKGVEKDYNKAYQLFALSAIEGDDVAIYKIGDMYKYGNVVEKNLTIAANLYIKAYHMKNDENKRTDNNFGCKAARMGDIFYEHMLGDDNPLAAYKFYNEAEIALIDLIASGDKYHHELLAKVRERKSKLKKKLDKMYNLTSTK